MKPPAYRPRVGIALVALSVPADLLFLPAGHRYAGGLFLAVFAAVLLWAVKSP